MISIVVIFSSLALQATDNVSSLIAQAQARAETQLVSDQKLSAAAACLAEIVREGGALNAANARFCADRGGVYDGTLIPMAAQAGRFDELPEIVARFFAGDVRERQLTHYGAALRKDEQSHALVILAAKRRGELLVDEKPAAPGKLLRFHGRLQPGYTRARSLMSTPSGKTQNVALTASGRDFAGKTLVDGPPGRYQLEVLAEASDGPHVIANLALFIGAAPPARPPSAVSSAAKDPHARMLELINAARKQTAARPLTLDAALTRVAEKHAKDMRDRGYFAHQSKETGSVVTRLQSAGIAYERAAENLAAAANADDAHQSLMASPGHRKNILDPNLTRVGIGVAEGKLSSGETSLVFVTDFIGVDPGKTEVSVRADALAAINQARRQTGQAPLSLDTALTRLAENHCRLMAEADALRYLPSQGQFFAEIEALAGSREIDTDLFLSNDGNAVKKSQNIGKKFSRVGVGVLAAKSPRYGSAYWITIIYVR